MKALKKGGNLLFPLPLPSIQRLLIFRKQLVVHCK